MTPFHKYTIFFTLVILIIWTFILIWLFRKMSSTSAWPPLAGTCPDYWTDVSAKSNGSECTINENNMGVPALDATTIMDFNTAPYIGSTGNCGKYTWANSKKVAWGGINYGVSNPCVVSS
jgi:hypothetical protein